MDEIYRSANEQIQKGNKIALATVVSTSGSTPRKQGAKMLIYANGQSVGTIGGGCGEAEVWQEAMDAIHNGISKMVTVDLTEDIEADDKICGGVMEIFVEII